MKLGQLMYETLIIMDNLHMDEVVIVPLYEPLTL